MAYSEILVELLGSLGISVMYKLKKMGPKAEPWETPDNIFSGEEISLRTLTLNIRYYVDKEKLNLKSIADKPTYQTQPGYRW